MAAETRAPGDQPNPALTTDVEAVGAGQVVRVSGEIDMSTIGDFESAIESAQSLAAASGQDIVVVDLQGVDFLGAESLRSLVAAHDRIAEAGGSLRVVAPPGGGIVRRLLDLTGVGALLDLFETVDAAVSPD